ncbi:hypothetical protein H4582DRAFT_2061417 [Lactarius indigo]|nr:hypothetical protein H4582DRAFT_2061417 [Lactarius indigo]
MGEASVKGIVDDEERRRCDEVGRPREQSDTRREDAQPVFKWAKCQPAGDRRRCRPFAWFAPPKNRVRRSDADASAQCMLHCQWQRRAVYQLSAVLSILLRSHIRDEGTMDLRSSSTVSPIGEYFHVFAPLSSPTFLKVLNGCSVDTAVNVQPPLVAASQRDDQTLKMRILAEARNTTSLHGRRSILDDPENSATPTLRTQRRTQRSSVELSPLSHSGTTMKSISQELCYISVRVVNFASSGSEDEDHVRLGSDDGRERVIEGDDEGGEKADEPVPDSSSVLPLCGRMLRFFGSTSRVRLAMYKVLIFPLFGNATRPFSLSSGLSTRYDPPAPLGDISAATSSTILVDSVPLARKRADTTANLLEKIPQPSSMTRVDVTITSGTTTVMRSLKAVLPLLARVAYFMLFAMALFSPVVVVLQIFIAAINKNVSVAKEAKRSHQEPGKHRSAWVRELIPYWWFRPSPRAIVVENLPKTLV